MELPPTPLWPLSLASGLINAGLAAYAWSRRSIPGARTLFVAMLALALVCVTAALEESSTTLSARLFWLNLQIVGYSAIAPCWFLLTLAYVGRTPVPRRIAALFLVPLATVILHWTNDWHGLYWSRVWIDRTGPIPIMGRVYGLGFWLAMVYNYTIIASGLAVLLRHFPKGVVQRRRTLLLLIAILLPVFANVLYTLDLLPVRHLDVTPYALSATGVCMVWVVFRYQFQGIVPVAARSVMESMPDAVIVLDLDGRVAELNPAAQELLNCAREGAIARRAADVFPQCRDALPWFEGETTRTGDITLTSRDRTHICSASAAAVKRNGRVIGHVVTLRDVTEERAAAEQLEQARRAAEAASIAKSQFLANMSHEIRTPMNSVVGAAELLLDTDLDPEQRELVRTAQESAHCLVSILNDILDFSKIAAGKLQLERIPFDLHRLIGQLHRLMAPVASQKGLALDYQIAPDVPRVVTGDPTRLRQVILNLVGNAVKFTNEGHVNVAVDLLRAAPDEALLAFTVEDTGIGIAPDRIEKLFQEFSQADESVTRRFGGTGLGLAISQRLVQNMGGTIRVESQLGTGTKFIIEAPMPLGEAEDVRETHEPGLAESERFPGCRVLLTEDNLVNQRIGQSILGKLGCQVHVAATGREALACVESNTYDVILMDVHMPDVDGLQATREMRTRGVTTPVVALTASVLDETRQTCSEAGMNDFITKPIRLQEITGVLRRFHGASAHERAAAQAAP